MRADTRAGFEKAMAKFEAAAEAKKVADEKNSGARQKFETEWKRIRDQVVVPAANVVGERILRPRGWRCEITTGDKNLEAKIAIYKAEMNSIEGGYSRPHLAFFTESAPSHRIVVYMASQLRAGDEGPTRDLGQLNEGIVQELMLKLLDRVVSEAEPRLHECDDPA